MNNKDTPSYPLPITSTVDGYTGSNANEHEHGLTKLEIFTGAAMQGILSNPSMAYDPKDLAKAAVDYAEAALAELEKRS